MPADHVSIGEVAATTGLTVRTLRYYEELGLLTPSRDAAGRRRYDNDALDVLYRVRLQRGLGTPLADVDPHVDDLRPLARRHLAELDARIAELARTRERVRSMEDRLLQGAGPTPAELLDLLSGLGDEPAPDTLATRRLTLLVCRDLEAAHRHLVEVFGFGAGPVTRDAEGRAQHGEVRVGDGVVWLHPEAEATGLASPLTSGTASACLAVTVDDVDAHHQRLRAAGASIRYEPTDMDYGVREYGARDLEGHLWSFQQVLTGTDTGTDSDTDTDTEERDL